MAKMAKARLDRNATANIAPPQRIIGTGKFGIARAIAIVVLVFCATNLAWIVLRTNLPTGFVSHWPWRLTLLELPVVVAVAAAALTVLLTLTGWGNAQVLAIKYSDHRARDCPQHNSSVLHDAPYARQMYVGNAGPGVAFLESILYRVRLTGAGDQQTDWLKEDELRAYLVKKGFVDQRDFVLSSIGVSGVLAETDGQPGSGTLLAAFSGEAVLKVAGLDVYIRVHDNLGRLFERTLLLAQSHTERGGEAAYQPQIRRALEEERKKRFGLEGQPGTG